MKIHSIRVAAFAMFGALFTANLDVAALAQSGEHHPGSPDYLHVRSDLYKAQTLMRAPEPADIKREENGAVGFITAAIRDVNRAAHLEDLNTAISPAPNELRGARLKEAEHVLDDAWNELSKPESDGRALPGRAAAIQDVRDAQTRVQRAEALDTGH
jgi:hypothetical protein